MVPDPSPPECPDTRSSTLPAEGVAIDPLSPPSDGVHPEGVYVQTYNARNKNHTLSEEGFRGSESSFTDTTIGRGPSSPSVEDHVRSIPHQQHHPKSWEELSLEEETLDVRVKRIGTVLGNYCKQFGEDPPESGLLEVESVSSEDDKSV